MRGESATICNATCMYIMYVECQNGIQGIWECNKHSIQLWTKTYKRSNLKCESLSLLGHNKNLGFVCYYNIVFEPAQGVYKNFTCPRII